MELIFFRDKHCAEKRRVTKKVRVQKKGTHTFGYFFAKSIRFSSTFLFELILDSNRKKKVPAKKAPKSMSSFSWNPSFFWGSYFGQDNVWPEKSTRSLVFWNSYFFFVTYTFFSTMFGSKKYLSSFFQNSNCL